MLRSMIQQTTVILLGCLAANAVAGEAYKIDGSHSMVVFSVKHLGLSYAYGQFTDFGGAFNFDPESKTLSDIRVEIKTNSINTHHEKRDKHLKSSDFFDVVQFPKMTFAADSAQANGDGTYEIKGQLTLHGVTKPVTLVMQEVGSGPDPWGGFRRGFHGSASIDRSDFDMSFLLEGIGDEVKIIISVEAVREKQ